MEKNLRRYGKAVCFIVAIAATLSACKKDLVLESSYPEQSVGSAQAAIATVGPGANGIFSITPKIEGQPYRFLADAASGKLKLQMGVLRSGVDLGGAVSVSVVPNNDTITKLLAAGRFPPGTELLPATAYSLVSAVTLEDGSNNAVFDVPVDLPFLTTNLLKKYAFAFTITGSKTGLVNPKLATAVIYLEPAAVLLPVANYSNSVNNLSRTVSLINLSANATTYSWNYGDGSPVESKVSPDHKYSASGTYSVTLTSTGVTSATSVKTVSIVIP